MDAVFIDGLPARVTLNDFRRHHLQSFPALAEAEYDDLISMAIDAVYTMFAGVGQMWDLHRDKRVWCAKTRLCYLLLAAWFIADQYPELSSALSVMGGAIKRKKVDGVDITFNTDLFKGGSPMEWLQSNGFGRKALMMMQTAPRRMLLRVTNFV